MCFFSFVNPYILSKHGLFPCFVFLTCLSSLLIPCGLFFSPLQKTRNQVRVDQTISFCLDVHNCKNG